MATLQTYDLKGLKLSFANWISNISPVDTPFVSMTGKESVDQVKYQWQIDRLAPTIENAVIEGSIAADGAHTATTEMENYTQILRKAVRVTNSAKATGLYGRSNELTYQMEKAGAELKRDLEHMFLNQGKGTLADKGSVRKTSGFRALVGTGDAVGGGAGVTYKPAGATADTDTGAVVVIESAQNTVTEEKLFELTTNLYLSGAKADTIMVHPKWMAEFSKFIARAGGVGRVRLFEDLDTRYNMQIKSIKDPLGQTFQIVPNRFMPEYALYVFNSKDWTQMVFRAPERTKLAVTGSSEKWMIEMEVGLRHRNPYASGILLIPSIDVTTDLKATAIDAMTTSQLDYVCYAYGIEKGIDDDATKAAIKKVFTDTTRVSTLDEKKEEVAVKATKAKK